MQNIPQSPIASRVAAFSLAATLAAGGLTQSYDVEAAAAKKPSVTQVGKSGLLKAFEDKLKSGAKDQGLEFPVEKECTYRKGQGGIAIGMRGVTGGPNVSNRSVMSSNSDIGFNGGDYGGSQSRNGASGYSSQATGGKSWTGYDAGMAFAGGALANAPGGSVAGALQQHIGKRLNGRDQLCLVLLDANSAWKNGQAGEVKKDVPYFIEAAAELEMARPIGDTTFNQAVRGVGKATRDVTGGFIDNAIQGLCPLCPR